MKASHRRVSDLIQSVKIPLHTGICITICGIIVTVYSFIGCGIEKNILPNQTETVLLPVRYLIQAGMTI